MKTLKKCLSLFLAILTLISLCSASTTVFAEEYTEQKARTEYFDSTLSGYLKSIVDTEDAVSISEKEQVDETIEEVQNSAVSTASTFSLRTASVQSAEETKTAKETAEELDIDHTRLTLQLEDGENVAYLFSEPISFIDDEGNLVYKDTNIKAVTDSVLLNRGYSYENGNNDYKAYFSVDSSKGLLLVEKDGEEIRLVPNGTANSVGTVSQIESNMEFVDSFKYEGIYGTDTLLRFLPQLNGCKEEIVLSSYQGISDFSFTLYTEEGTIAALNSSGEVEIIDSATKDIITTFVAPFAYDSSGGMDETSEHYTDCTYNLESLSEGKYTLTISVPKEYLESENTVYPVIVDPTTDNISMTYDTSVYEGLSDSAQSSNPTACFGKTGSSEYGKGRAMFYFKIPSDIEKYAKISSAKLWLRETTGRTRDMYVRPYLIKDAWNNTVTWDTIPAHYSTCSYPTKTDLSLPRRNINSASTDNADVPYWYAFNIIYAVKAWTTGTRNRGLMFIAECEAADGDYLWRAFATKEHTTSAYRPYAVIKYTNDATVPTIDSVSGNPTGWTKSNVTLTVTATDNVYKEGGIASYSFDNGDNWQTSETKTFKENQTVKIKVKDLAGNISAATTVKITKIDKTAPTISKVALSTTGWTNGSVKVTVTASDSASGLASKAYSFDNGSTWQANNYKTYTANNSAINVKVRDAVGNIATYSSNPVKVTKIDKTAPTISSVSGNPTSWTNANVTFKVTATDTGGSGIASYSFDNGSTWQTSASKVFSANQTVNIKVKDNAGNISAVKQEVISKIDKVVPTASVSSTATSASTKVTVTASDALSGLHSTPYSFDGGSSWQSGNTTIVTSTTTLSIKVRDKAGNIKTLSHTPSATLPITITPSTTDWTNGKVRLTVSGTGISQYKFDSGSYSTTNYKDYSENTTASITVKDSNSKTKTVTYKITNIDTTNPVISDVAVSRTEWTKDDVTITVTASDALPGLHATPYSFDGGVTWQTSNKCTFTENKTDIIVAVKDKAGNISYYQEKDGVASYCHNIEEATEINITNIDKVAPTAPFVYEQDGILHITAPFLDKNGGSAETLKYQIGGSNDDNYTEVVGNSVELEVVRTYNVPIYACVVDGAGNSTVTSFILENTLGEYTASYTDIALGEGLFPVEFGRTYTSTNGWFFTFDANIVKIDDNSYVFTDFYGEKQYFIKNGEGKYLSVDEEELTVNSDSYQLAYGDMNCTFNSDGKLIQIKTDYLETDYTWNEDGTLTITGGATVTFTDGKPTKINITRTDSEGTAHTKEVDYVWTEGNLTKFIDAADVEHIYAYDENGLLTTNETETIDYSNGRVKRITQPNGAFVKYTYNDNAENAEAPNNIGAVTVSDSKGVTDTIYYADGVYISNTLDSYSDNAEYAPESIADKLAEDTTDIVTNIFYVVEELSEDESADETSGETDAEGTEDTSTDETAAEEETTADESETAEEKATEETVGETPLYEEIDESTYAFYIYDEQGRVTAELEVLKANITDITTATFESAEAVAESKVTYVYFGDDSKKIAEEVYYSKVGDEYKPTDKYTYTYTEDGILSTEKYAEADENYSLCLNYIFTYDADENIVLEQYYRQETENEITVDVEYENCTRVYEGENIKTETQQTLVDGVLTDTKQLSYEYDIGNQLTNYTVKEYTLGDLRTVNSELYSYNSFGNIASETDSETSYYFDSDANDVKENEFTIVTEYKYDIWNQQEKITVTKNSTVDSTTVITYDDLGNISSVTEDGVTVAYEYSNGNVSKITETKTVTENNEEVQKTEITEYIYADNGNLISRKNPNGTVASYVYDKYGNLNYHEFNGYAFTYNTLGSILTAKAAVQKDENGNETSVEIVSYTYSPDIKQDILNSSFGNNQIIAYEYNPDGEIIAIKLGADADPKYEYKYSSEAQTETEGEDILTANLEGEWVKINDKVSGLFKVIQENKTSVYDSNEAFVYSVETSSKDADNADSFDGTVTTIGDDVYTLVTEENKDTFKTNGTTDFTKEYTYVNDELNKIQTAGITTSYGYNAEKLISVLENTLNDVSQVYGYAYDDNGNITTETLTTISKDENGATVETNQAIHYTYDDKEQLISAETSSIKYEYTYDDRGNILAKKEYSISLDENNQKVYTLIENSTVTYAYDETWKDKLISYNGQSITYDAVGNPTNYMGNELTWTMGRQLSTFGNNTYTYNEDGIRTSRTVDGVKTTFLLDGYNVIEQTDGTTTLHFFYDSNGELIGFRYNGNDYFYVKNAMSDIIAITDSNKNIVAEYRYDPWGKVLDEENLTAIGNLNPFRYRSYYYDSDIKMYYLQSRYYDAEVGRFINCDDVSYIGITESEISYNPFTYCENNAASKYDEYGTTSRSLLNKLFKNYRSGLFLLCELFAALALLNSGNPYNAFHELTQIIVATQLFNTGRYSVELERPCQLNKRKEIDIWAYRDQRRGGINYIWEVKPYKQSSAANKQIKEYLKLNKGYVQGFKNKTIRRTIIDDMLDIKITFDSKGGIYYAFYDKDNKRITNSELYKKVKKAINIFWGAVATSTVFVAGGIAIVVYSGGTATTTVVSTGAKIISLATSEAAMQAAMFAVIFLAAYSMV